MAYLKKLVEIKYLKTTLYKTLGKYGFTLKSIYLKLKKVQFFYIKRLRFF